MQDPNQVISRLTHVESDLEHLGGIIKGDGKDMGIGPMVLQHDEEICALKDLVTTENTKMDGRVRMLEDGRIRMAAWVGGAVAAAVAIVEVLFRLWDSLPK